MRWSLVWAAFKKSFYSRNYLINISALNERCIQDLALLYEPNKRWGEPLSRAVFNNWPDLVVFILIDVIGVPWSICHVCSVIAGFLSWIRITRHPSTLRASQRPSSLVRTCWPVTISRKATATANLSVLERSGRSWIPSQSFSSCGFPWLMCSECCVDWFIYWFSQLGSSGSNCATSLFSAVRMRTGLQICLQISWARLNA